MNKIYIYTVIFIFWTANVTAYTRVFYEDYEDTSYTTHFLEDQFGSRDFYPLRNETTSPR